VMERGGVEEVFDAPGHPYTRALMECLPGVGSALDPIPGDPIDPTDPPAGCRFHPRCTAAVAECESGEQPPLHDFDGGRTDEDGPDGEEPTPDAHCVSCVFYGPDRDPAEMEAAGVSEVASVSEAAAVAERADDAALAEEGDDG